METRAQPRKKAIVQILWVYRCSSEYIAQNEKCLMWFFISTMVRAKEFKKKKQSASASSSSAHLDIGEIDPNELASVLWV